MRAEDVQVGAVYRWSRFYARVLQEIGPGFYRIQRVRRAISGEAGEWMPSTDEQTSVGAGVLFQLPVEEEMANDRTAPVDHRIENTQRQIENARGQIAIGAQRTAYQARGVDIEKLLDGHPLMIQELDPQADRLLVQAAAVGSVYVRKSTIEVKLATGWRSIAATRESLTDDDLDKMTPEMVDLLYQAADAELLKQTVFVDKLARRNSRQV